MQSKNTCVIALVLICSTGCGEYGGEVSAGESGDYFGEPPPGAAPRLFGAGLLSTDLNELNCAFAPDGSMVVFSEWSEGQTKLMAIAREGDGWSPRAVLPFSGSASDVDPFFSADGSELYFSSKRPRDDDDTKADSDLWYVKRTPSGDWGQPVPVAGVNSPDMDEYYTSISSRGALYFSVFAEHGSPGDIYRADREEGGYASPERIGGDISTEYSEHDPFIAPDESFLIFTSTRPGGHGRGDLWVAFQMPDGGWSEALNMGPEVNSEGYDYCPMLSPDGQFLFFTRNAGGNGDIYWVDAKVIERLRGNLQSINKDATH